MKIDPHCKMRSVAGENIVLIPSPKPGENNKILSFNETACMLWNNLFGMDFELEDVTKLLTETFDVEESVARKDAENWVALLKEKEVLK